MDECTSELTDIDFILLDEVKFILGDVLILFHCTITVGHDNKWCVFQEMKQKK